MIMVRKGRVKRQAKKECRFGRTECLQKEEDWRAGEGVDSLSCRGWRGRMFSGVEIFADQAYSGPATHGPSGEAKSLGRSVGRLLVQ